MEKKWIYLNGKTIGDFNQIFRTMKLITLFLFVSFFQLSAATYSQSTRLKISGQNLTLGEIFEGIEKQSEFSIFYNVNQIDLTKRIDINADNQLVDQILDAILVGTGMTYTINNKLIVIHKQNDASSVAMEQQQDKKVTGKVTDSSGATLPGVSVVVKGTTTGIITDNNGAFSLSNVPGNAVLQFSFVGMKTQEIAVAGKTLINVNMEEETIGLEEVVAIGYGTIKKSDLTGSVASVKLKDANNNANVNVLQTLQGSVPGLNIGAVTSAGGDPSLLIRGYTSLSAGLSPLIVVDGIIFHGSISDLSTNDIERVDILKDASAAAVYGSRSANGVIIITTKQGVSEKPVFNFNVYRGFQSPARKMKMSGPDKYIQKILDSRAADGYEADPNKVVNYLDPAEVENYRNKTSVDWVDLLIQETAPISQYDLSVSGKTNKTNYYLSVSHTAQEGVVVGDDFTRTIFRANFSNDINKWLTIGLSSNFSHRDYSGKNVGFDINAIGASPYASIYDKYGKLNLVINNNWNNPLTNLNAKDVDIRDNFYATLFTDIKIPGISGLKFHFDYTADLEFSKHNQFWGTDTYTGYSSPNGYGEKDYSEGRNWQINNILSYSKKINKFSVDATLLYSRESSKEEDTEFEARNFSSLELGYNAMDLGSVQKGSSNAEDSRNEAFMSRVVCNYDLKYLLTATFRRDGFSGFAKGNKYANLPSLSLGWVISEENFAKSFDWLNLLKLRLSYGINGNQALGSYGSLSRMKNVNYVYGDGGATSIGRYPSTMANLGLTWEKTSSLNLGLDFGVLNKKISGEIDVYKGATNDLLITRSIPTMTGYKSVWDNLGKLENKGIEVTLNTVNVSTKDLRWETKFFFSLNRNKIVHLYGLDANGDGKEDDDMGNKWFIGKSIGAIYDYTIDGVYQIGDNIPSSYHAGNFRLKDIDGDGNVTSDEGDKSIVGYDLPNYRAGISNELKYKNISLSFMINTIQGGGKDNYYIIKNPLSVTTLGTKHNLPDALNYWTPTNPINTMANISSIYTSNYVSDYIDRSFVRLQDVTLAYSFGKTILDKLGINSLKVYLSGKNLYTWTHYGGWDPEAGSGYGAYPAMFSIIGGLNITF